MINKQASALPRRLIRKFKCNDPFELAEALDIDVMERADFKRQKGAFKVILFRPFAALRGFDDEISSEGASKLLVKKVELSDEEKNDLRYTVARVTKVVEKNKTKNASSFRSFPLTDDAVRLFKILLQQEQYYRNHFGRDYIDNDYVFTWEDGHPYSPDYVSHTFHKLLKKYDLPHIRFHDLRHTCASMLLSEGYGLKDVQEWLGHSDIKMTANIYGHLDIRRKRSIANGLEQALPRLKP